MASVRAVLTASFFLLTCGCGHELALSGDEASQPPAGVDRGELDAGSSHFADPGWGPPYPLVLAHGFAGFDQIGPVEYFYEVPQLLRDDGHQVFVAQVDPFNDSYARGAELLAYVQGVLAQTGAAKVDIIAHSQGGLDARWVAHTDPGAVAAVVTIATPHRGTPIADLAVSGPGGGLAMNALEELSGALSPDGGVAAGFVAAINQMTSAGTAQFNQTITDAPGVAYFSIAGRSNFAGNGGDCQTSEPAFLSRWNPYVDPTGPEFLVTGPILCGNLLDPSTNDGLVPATSAQWDTFLGCIPADHFEEIGQLLGQPAGPGNPFAYRDFYRELADWLVQQGY